MYIVGVDIAKRNHEAMVMDPNGNTRRKPFSFSNSESGFQSLLEVLDSVSHKPSDFVIAMESTAHYWYALHDFLVKKGYSVTVLNSLQSSSFRNMDIRPVKTDAKDSALIADVIRFDRYSKSQTPASQVRTLREMCRARYFISDMAGDVKKKVIALLDQVFPEYETIFSNIFGLTSTALLLRAPTPEEILSLSDEELFQIISVPSRKRYKMDKALSIKALALRSVGVRSIGPAVSLLLKQHMAHIQFLSQQLKDMERQIAELFNLFDSPITTIPGIGSTLGAVIFSEIGDISRFPSAAKLVAFAGIDPAVKQSGQFSAAHRHMSKRGSPYLRRAIWMAAASAVQCDPALRSFFERKRTAGKSYMCAIGHVTRKLTAIIFAVLRDGKPYVSKF